MFIEAEDVQKVKYYFHKHYRQFGWNPSWATNKHTIHNIKEIADPIKAKVLEEELFKFPKD